MAFGGQPITKWNELAWPKEYPLAYHEMSILLPHLVKEGRGKLDVYFSRVYNPIWTNPDGFTWMEALLDESKRHLDNREYSLFVYRDNEPALRCYRAAGFRASRYPEGAPLADECYYLTRPVERRD